MRRVQAVRRCGPGQHRSIERPQRCLEPSGQADVGRVGGVPASQLRDDRCDLRAVMSEVERVQLQVEVARSCQISVTSLTLSAPLKTKRASTLVTS